MSSNIDKGQKAPPYLSATRAFGPWTVHQTRAGKSSRRGNSLSAVEVRWRIRQAGLLARIGAIFPM